MKVYFFVLLIFLSISYGATVTADNAGYVACSTAIANANSGDTVYIPYVNKIIWRNGIAIYNKKLTIIGEDSSGQLPYILDSIPINAWGKNLFWVDGAYSDTFHIKKLKITNIGPSKTYGHIAFKDMRFAIVDSCVFSDSVGLNPSTSMRSVCFLRYARGVFSHNIVYKHLNSTAQGLACWGDSAGDQGVYSWSKQSTYGTNDAVFVENNQFIYDYKNDEAIDNYGGARVVFKYNVIIGTGIGWHGFDSGNYRSVYELEAYNNTFVSNKKSLYTSIRSRGGSCLIYNNTFRGNYDRLIILSNYRSCPGHDGYHNGANGTTMLQDLTANFLTGDSVRYVYKINTNEWDTVKTKTVTTLTSDIVWSTGDRYATSYYPTDCGMCMGYSPCDKNTKDSGWACLDQIGRGTNQTSSPVYLWNNDYNGNLSSPVTNNYNCKREALHIQENRDYFRNTEKPGYKPYHYPIFGKQQWIVRKPQ